MKKLMLLRDRRAATAIEYGLLVALIAVACLVAFQMAGLSLAGVFTTINEAFRGALGG